MPRRISAVGSQTGGGSIYQTLRQQSATPTGLAKYKVRKAMKVFCKYTDSTSYTAVLQNDVSESTFGSCSIVNIG